MKKVLITATVQSHIAQFHKPLAEMLHNQGYEVHIAAKNNLAEKNDLVLNFADKIFDVPFSRSPKSIDNVKAYKILKKIVGENDYEVIHCNTPMAAIVTRLVGRKLHKNKTKIIYTAHGFHFFKGSSKLSWLVFYPIEKIFSRFTDILITINKEDYQLSQKKMKAKRIEYVQGVGIDTEKFVFDERLRTEKRKELGLNPNDIMLISVGELNKNKNQQAIIRALSKMDNKNIQYFIVGNGGGKDNLEKLINELHLENNVHLLGYRRDIAGLYSASDICCFPSMREGLPVALMEAMSCGLACVAANIRGVCDLIENKDLLVKSNDIDAFKEKIELLIKDEQLRKDEGNKNRIKSLQFSEKIVKENLESIYFGGNLFKGDSGVKKFILISPKNRTAYNFRGDLIKKIISLGYEVIVTGPNLDNVEKIEELGARFEEISMNKNGINPINDLKYKKQLYNLFKRENPDVVLGYTSKPVIYSSMAAKKAHVPKRVGMITGLGYAFTAKTKKAKIIKVIVSILYKKALSCVDTVIFQNEDDKELFVNSGLVKKEKCRIVNGSGVNTERFSFKPYPEKITFFMLSRVMFSKGIREYLRACEIVKEKYPETRFMLLGACEGIQDSISKDLLQDYIDRGIIEYFGETEDVREYYAECSVYVLPSYREGTPRTVLEAMSMARPVITTDTAGCKETVIDGETGFLVPIKDSNAVAEKMIRFIENPKLISEMGKKSQEYCYEKFDVNKVNENMCKYLGIEEK